MGFLVFKEHMIPLDWYFMKWLDVIYRLYLKTFNIWLKSCYIFNKTESYIFSSLNHITLFEFEDSSQSMFDNLATLADVMLASAGQLEDKSLKRKIDLARAKISQTILPITPEMSSKRTMQVITYLSCIWIGYYESEMPTDLIGQSQSKSPHWLNFMWYHISWKGTPI